jgi:hypothetical protein
MKLGICTIQRDRGRWITEWCAFHYLVGFRHFTFFAHRCTDDTYDVLRRLRNRIDLTVYTVPDHVPRPQLAAYRFGYERHGNDVDWMAFIDGDEFLFPTQAKDIAVPIAALDNGRIGALAVYWACFGSSGHIKEPDGLIVENYRRRAPDNFVANGHVKSIVRGGLGSGFHVLHNGHLFDTPGATFDERNRFIELGLTGYPPSWDQLRINHYVTQSREYFTGFKQRSGAADMMGGRDHVRPESWWTDHDRNEVHDTSMERFYGELKSLIRDWAVATSRVEPAAVFPMMPELPREPPLPPPDTSRNRPCPCGSGKRFKHCHGAADRLPATPTA